MTRGPALLGLLGLLALFGPLAACELIASIPDPSTTPRGDGGTSDDEDGSVGDGGIDGPAPECLVSAACTTPTAPVCGADHACRACVDDPECTSGVCLPDGTCADPARFLYAAPTGTGATCTASAPCTVDTALTRLTPTLDIVKLAVGTYPRSAPLELTGTGILAGSGAKLVPAGLADFSYVLTTSGAQDLLLLGLEVASDATHNGISCTGGTLRFVRTAVTSANVGMSSSACGLVFDRARFAGIRAYAIYANRGTLTMHNSYIVNNSSAGGTDFGALFLDQVASGEIASSTFANNGTAPSISCLTSPTVRVHDVISAGNAAPADPERTCTFDHSIVEAGYALGASNQVVDPQFVDAAAGNYHIKATSPARGYGDPANPVLRDGDGEIRPQPAATPPDVGADEIP